MYKVKLFRESAHSSQSTKEFLYKYKNILKWDENEMVLDIGSGPGDNTMANIKPLMHPTSTLIMSDISTVMLKAAQQYAGPNIFFIEIDITNDSFKSKVKINSIDKVTSMFVLHFLRNQERIISNIHAVLKPGGHFIALLQVKSPMFVIYEKLLLKPYYVDYFDIIKERIPLFHEWDDPATEYCHLVKSQGFSITACTTSISHIECTLDIFINLFESIDTVMDRLPPNLKERYLDDCRQIIKDNLLLTSSKGLMNKVTLLEVIAVKMSE